MTEATRKHSQTESREEKGERLARELQEANFRLNQKVVQMETLYQVGLNLSAFLNVDEVVGEFLRLAVAMVDGRKGFLFLKDEGGRQFNLVEQIDMDDGQVRLLADAALRRKMRRVVSSGSPIYLDAEQLAPGFDGAYVLVAPVGEMGFIGVVDRESRQGVQPFSESDGHLLQLMGQQAGMALANAQLYRGILEERNLNRNIFNSVANGVISTDLKGAIVRANPAVGRIFGSEPMAGRSCVRFLKDSGCSEIASAVATSLVDGEERQVEDERVASADVLLDARISPLRGEAGAIEGVVVALEDLSVQDRLQSMFKKYASDQVVDLLLQGDVAPTLGGETRDATMLFIDFVGSTELMGEIGGDEMVRLINDCYTRLVDVVFRYNGTLDKYTGDGFLAVYGAPVSMEDDTRRAVQSALEMLREMKRFNRSREIPLAIKIGISRGQVTAGNFGSPRRMEYSVIGPDVSLAARLCDFARSGQILVSSGVYAELKEDISFDYEGRHIFKGKREPMEVYCAVGSGRRRKGAAGSRRQRLKDLDKDEARIVLDIPMIQDMELTVSRTAEAVGQFMGMDDDKVEEIKPALIEACINAFEHSRSKEERLEVEFIVQPESLTIVITDRGHGFDVEGALAKVRRRRERGEMRRGWGLELMGQFMDEVDIESDKNGTTLTLVKRR